LDARKMPTCGPKLCHVHQQSTTRKNSRWRMTAIAAARTKASTSRSSLASGDSGASFSTRGRSGCGSMASLLLRRERGFLQSLDLVAEAGGGFVVLAGDRLLEVGAELGELGLHLLRLGESTRRLAAVSRLAVDVLEQRRQLLAEDLVVVGAT